MPAPIALFAYRRPDHLSRTLAALQRNPEATDSPLYIFSDAAKGDDDHADVVQVREILRGLRGFCKIIRVEHPGNIGLARNIIGGIGQVLSDHDKVIVMEDDLVCSSHYLRFMNDALSRYRHESRVANVTGYCYPVFRRLPETFLVRASVSWGWATWRDRWAHFNPDGSALLSALRERDLAESFNFDGSINYAGMLEDQIAGRNDSWAIRWYASCFLRKELVLFPGRSLIQNIGNDGSAGHHTRRGTSIYDVVLSGAPISVSPIPAIENQDVRAAFAEYFRATQRRFSRLRRLWHRFRYAEKH